MKNYLKRSQEGFTLVELMVVVAIIGVLASIAIPQYAKFTAKARQSEARLALGSVYTIEQSFAAEQSTYTSCIGKIGFARDGSKFYYGVGTKLGGTGCGPTGGKSCDVISYTYSGGSGTGTWSATGQTCVAVDTQFSANLSDGSATGVTGAFAAGLANVPTQTTFNAAAAGTVSKGKTDEWTIDQGKSLSNIVGGI